MPYGRYRRYRKYGRMAGRFIRRHATYRNFRRGVNVYRDLRYLKSVINVEKKYSDINATITPSTTPNIILLNGLQIGDTSTTREGQTIKMWSVQWKIVGTINTAATTTNVRVIVFRDRQPNGAAPTAANLLQNGTGINSPLNISFGRRFLVYYDRQKTLSVNGTEGMKMWGFKRLKFHTQYNTGNVGDITDISTNSLYVLIMSDQATNTPSVAYYFRIRWIDN